MKHFFSLANKRWPYDQVLALSNQVLERLKDHSEADALAWAKDQLKFDAFVGDPKDLSIIFDFGGGAIE